jgi:hypothetical protein
LFSVEVFVEEPGEVLNLSFVALIEDFSAFLFLLDFDFVSLN